MAQLLRQLQQSDIRCPAGEVVGDACVHCRVEDTLINGREDPSSIENLCGGEYTACPSWRHFHDTGELVRDIEKPAEHQAMADLAARAHADRARQTLAMARAAVARKEEMIRQGWKPGPNDL